MEESTNNLFTLYNLKVLDGLEVGRDPIYNAQRYRQYSSNSSAKQELLAGFQRESEKIKLRVAEFIKSNEIRFDLICAIPSSNPIFTNPVYEAAKEANKNAVDISPYFKKIEGAYSGTQDKNQVQLFELKNDLPPIESQDILLVDDICSTGRSANNMIDLLKSVAIGNPQFHLLTLLKVEKYSAPNLPADVRELERRND